MAKEGVIGCEGVVPESLPNTLFLAKLENGPTALCHISGVTPQGVRLKYCARTTSTLPPQ